MRVTRLLALGQHHDVQFACGGLHFLELRIRAIQRRIRELVRLIIFQKLRQELLAVDLTLRELFERRGPEFAHGWSGLIGRGKPEFRDVGVAIRRTMPQLENEFFIVFEHQRLGKAVKRRVGLILRKSLRGPAIARIVIERAFHIAILAGLAFDLRVRHGAFHEDVADLRAAFAAHLHFDVGEDELA